MGSSIHFVIFSALFFFDVLSVGEDGEILLFCRLFLSKFLMIYVLSFEWPCLV